MVIKMLPGPKFFFALVFTVFALYASGQSAIAATDVLTVTGRRYIKGLSRIVVKRTE